LRQGMRVRDGIRIPLGKTNVPFSAPVAIALLSWVFWAAPISSLYVSSTYLEKVGLRNRLGYFGNDAYFLIWGRETPVRASSGWAVMHSYRWKKRKITIGQTLSTPEANSQRESCEILQKISKDILLMTRVAMMSPSVWGATFRKYNPAQERRAIASNGGTPRI
jgi:hypothetical protein